MRYSEQRPCLCIVSVTFAAAPIKFSTAASWLHFSLYAALQREQLAGDEKKRVCIHAPINSVAHVTWLLHDASVPESVQH